MCCISVPERDVEFFSDTLVFKPGKIKSFAGISNDLDLSYLKTNTRCNNVQRNYMPNTNIIMLGQNVATHLAIVYEMSSSKKKIPTKQMVSEAAVKAKEVYVIVRKLMKDNIKRQKLYDDRKLNWNHLIRVNNGNVTQVVLLSG